MAQKALPGETVSGDLHLVLPHGRGLLLAVVDGVGHGREATAAAEIAVATLRSRPEDNVLQHFRRCHAALGDTRGVVMTLADHDVREGTLTLSGVGNVEAMLYRPDGGRAASPRECAVLRGGTVGANLPEPFASVVLIKPEDVLIIATDGIRTNFGPDLPLRSPAQRLAETILQKHFKGNDDGLVLVARFPEGSP